jgi:hypothetical protein
MEGVVTKMSYTFYIHYGEFHLEADWKLGEMSLYYHQIKESVEQ